MKILALAGNMFKRLCIFGPKGAIQIRYYYYYYYYYMSFPFHETWFVVVVN